MTKCSLDDASRIWFLLGQQERQLVSESSLRINKRDAEFLSKKRWVDLGKDVQKRLCRGMEELGF